MTQRGHEPIHCRVWQLNELRSCDVILKASVPGRTVMADLPKRVRSGGCQCGALRYALRSEPTHTSICWCHMCQKASGNYFQAFTGVPRADFVWTRGQPGTFHSSAAVARDFCGECGTPLTYRRVAVDRISVTVGSLDQPYDFPSEVQYGIENRPHFADRITRGEGITSAQSTARAPGNYATRQHPDHDTHEWLPTSVGNAPSNRVRR
jgi:hypothetical protein